MARRIGSENHIAVSSGGGLYDSMATHASGEGIVTPCINGQHQGVL